MHVSTHLTGNKLLARLPGFQGLAPYLKETSAEAPLMCFPQNLLLLALFPWQQLIPGGLFSTESIIFSVAVFPQADFWMEVTHVTGLPKGLPLLPPHT